MLILTCDISIIFSRLLVALHLMTTLYYFPAGYENHYLHSWTTDTGSGWGGCGDGGSVWGGCGSGRGGSG